MEDFKKSTYWNVWADVCRIHRDFYGITEEDTARWEKLFQCAKNIRDKYKNSDAGKFAEALVLLVVSELEDRSKKGGHEDAEKE